MAHAPFMRYAPGSPNEPCIAGPNARVFRECVVELYGAEKLDEALRAVPVEVREEFSLVVVPAWVRLSTMEAVFASLAHLRGATIEAQWEALVRQGAQRWFRTVWRVLLGLSSDAGLISRASMVYGRTRNVGTMTSRVVSPGHAEFELTGAAGLPHHQLRVLGVAMGQILEAAGRKDARFVCEITPQGANYRATWRVK